MLKGKTVLLGVSGGIAAYKTAGVASRLTKLGASVEVVMTQNATEFITPNTFEALTKRRCVVDTFDRSYAFQIEHISLAKKADVVLIAPATANIIAKLAHGLADDMLSTTVLACRCPKIIAPAMNTAMYENPITQKNIQLLRDFGFQILEPEVGRLACRDVGAGKMPEAEVLTDAVLREIACEKDLAGKRVLVTAGPTREALDPVRYLSNHSTGKMGYAIAEAAMRRGAEVILISGKTQTPKPRFVPFMETGSAAEMFNAVKARYETQDIIIKAAAVADYTPVGYSDEKLKKADGGLTLPLGRTVDILGWLGEHRRAGQFLCGFSMETQHMLENSREKLLRKKIDLIAANNLKTDGAGFGTDTNVVTLISKEGETALPMLTKEETAHRLLDEILKLWGRTTEFV